MERALLVTIKKDSDKDGWEIEDSALELEELVASAGVEVVDNISYRSRHPTANFFIGSGKAEEIGSLARELDVDVVIFNHDLSGTHQRNLEEVLDRKTIDCTQLILDIFARHARTPEGQLQVELAQLQYLIPRLVGKGIMLSRLGGGIGTRGPGEQKLEVDRRRIRKIIEQLKTDLKTVVLHRATMRKKRNNNDLPSVALVGYTNAGKSTLINALTGSGQVVSNGLFTTLDPLARKMVLPSGEAIVISDTVGFLHNLPHHLIEAFKATLEEVVEADLLIHVLDVSHPRVYEHSQAVFAVLKELQADKKTMITALNKIDCLDDRVWLERVKQDYVNALPISAKTGENIALLLDQMQKNVGARMEYLEILIPHKRMDLVDLFYREGKVEAIEYLEKGIEVKLSLPKVLFSKLMHNSEIKRLN